MPEDTKFSFPLPSVLYRFDGLVDSEELVISPEDLDGGTK